MRAPRQLPHRIFVARQHRQRALCRRTNIKRPNQTIDACDGDDGLAVLVPVVCEGFGGWVRGAVDGEFEGEMI
jgi:hypothetical protein